MQSNLEMEYTREFGYRTKKNKRRLPRERKLVPQPTGNTQANQGFESNTPGDASFSTQPKESSMV